MTTRDLVGRRVVAVHAHPDDEAITTGGTLFDLARRGADVLVVTCTLGEEGEVIPPALAHLEGSPELADHRREELAQAMATLGVGHTFLGADPSLPPGQQRPRWRDSGMAGSEAARHPDAFVAAPVDEAAALLAARLRELRPDVVLTYDPTGGYQHPDHIKVHEVTVAAWAQLAEDERGALFMTLTPQSWAQEDRRWLAAHVPAQQEGLSVPAPGDPYPSSVVPDDQVTHQVIDPSVTPVRDRALRAHATQVTVGEGYFALSNDIAARLVDREGYRRYDVTELDAAGGPA